MSIWSVLFGDESDALRRRQMMTAMRAQEQFMAHPYVRVTAAELGRINVPWWLRPITDDAWWFV